MSLISPLADDSLMRDLRVAITVSHALNHQRTTNNRRWPSRIEKPRSTHTSPTRESRRRAWSGASQISSSYSLPHGFSQQTPLQRTQRPLSWHSTFNQVPMYTSSPLSMNHGLPSQYTEFTPQIFSAPVPPYDVPDLYPHTGQLSNSSSSSFGLPNTSPIWDTPIQQSFMHQNSLQSYPTPTSMNLWQTPMNNLPSEPCKPEVYAYPHILSNIHDPDTNALEDIEDDGGEILVALGLYDDSVETEQPNRPLKLAESWKPPPPSESDDSEAESDSSEDNVKESESHSESTQSSNPSVMESYSQSSSMEHMARKDWCYNGYQSQMHGLGYRTGLLQGPA